MKEQKVSSMDQEETYHPQGKTTVAPEVLLTISRLTTLSVPGVNRMGNAPARVDRLFQRGYGEGVSIDIKDDVAAIDLHIILNQDVNFRDVSRLVQRSVARAISEMVGIQVGRVNVHIEDIEYASAEQGSAESAEAREG